VIRNAIVRHGAATLLAAALAAPLVSPLAAQQDLSETLAERKESIPRGKHVFDETWLLPENGVGEADAARFAGRVTVYQEAPRERIEVRPVQNGRLAEPIVIVSDGDAYHLVTKVGATPLEGSAPASDAFVRLVLAGPAGAAPRHRVVPAAGGGVAAVVLRNEGRPAFDSGSAFELRLPQVGGGLLKSGLSSFSPAGNTQVTSAAGARGVGQVRTADGTISVTPDPGAVEWMEQRSVSAVELESFKLAERLPPYDALPMGESQDAVAPQGGS